MIHARRAFAGAIARSSAGILLSIGTCHHAPAATAQVWTPFGPEGGPIQAIAVDPQRPATVYLGMWSDQGVYKSTDGGAHWAPARDGLDLSRHVLAVAVLPTDSDVVFAATANRQVYRSLDGGATWELRSTGMPPTGSVGAATFAFDPPANPAGVYVAWSTWEGKLYHSTDRGDTWVDQANGPAPGPVPGQVWVLVVISSPQPPPPLVAAPTAYAATGPNGVWKSDMGAAFVPANTGLPFVTQAAGWNRYSVSALAVDPTRPERLYAVSGEDGRVYRSEDAAATWTAASAEAPQFRRLISRPGSADVFALGSDILGPAPTYRDCLFRSTDHGATWTNLTPGHLNADAVAFHPTDPLRIHAKLDEGFYTSADGGATWTPSSSGLRALETESLAFDPTNPATYFVGSRDGLYKTIDGGSTFAPITGTLAEPLGEAFLVDPAGPDRTFTGAYPRRTDFLGPVPESGLVWSDDGGATWTAVPNPSYPEKQAMHQTWSLLALPTSPTTIFTATAGSTDQARVYRSDDGGATFVAAGAGIPAATRVGELAASTGERPALFAAARPWNTPTGGGLYRSFDNGQSWAISGTGWPANPDVRTVVVHPRDPLRLFAGASGMGAGDAFIAGIFASRDGGDTWSLAPATGWPASAAISIAIDPEAPHVMYACAGTVGGVLRSTDGGNTWLPFEDGLGSRAVWQLAVDPADHRHVIAVSRGGLYETRTAPLDTISAGTVAGRPGTTVQVPILLRDLSGTPLDGSSPAGARPQSFAVRVAVAPAGAVSSLAIARSGVTAGLSPLEESIARTASTATLSATFDAATDPLPLALDAPAPGSEIATLTVAVAPTAPVGSEIEITIDPGQTRVSSQDLSVNETVAEGTLGLSHGAVTLCGIECAASGPTNVIAGVPAWFSGSAALSHCAGAAAFDWDFGDGSPHSAEHTPSHAFAAPGLFTWIMTMTAGGATCTRTGIVSASPPQPAGAAFMWGVAAFGHLGDAPPIARTEPVAVAGPPHLRQIASGLRHTVARRFDGTVWSWGANDEGQLGVGATPRITSTPVQVPGLAGIAALSSSYYHTLALRSDGTLLAWGYNSQGALGDGSAVTRFTPVEVPGLSGVVAASAGAVHSLAVTAGGGVWAWGGNGRGQLGDGSKTNRLQPVGVAGLPASVDVAAGQRHSLALAADGTVWAWGNNEYGQLGDGTTAERLVPQQVPGLSSVTAIAAGYFHNLALLADGTLRAWGRNVNGGMVGSGHNHEELSPTEVVGLSGVAAVSSSQWNSLARRGDGSVWAWGRSGAGQCGRSLDFIQPLAAAVPGIGNAVAVDAGESVGFAVLADGSTVTWGAANGAAGDGLRVYAPSPERVPVAPEVTVMSIGGGAGSSVASDGTVWTWGSNDSGQLGTGTAGMVTEGPAQVPGVSDVVTVAQGFTHGLALDAAGRVFAWGGNHRGQLGDASRPHPSPEPAPVPGLDGVVAIAAGWDASWAIAGDGTLWAWGSNDNGILGDGTTSGRATPAVVAGLPPVRAVATQVFGYHTLALARDGSVWAWGSNTFGQLGDGTNASRYLPARVQGLTGIVAVALTTWGTSYALDGAGRVWSWGAARRGQLGDGATADRWLPAAIPGLEGVVEIAAGDTHAFARTGGGQVYAWGLNLAGQLGLGDTEDRWVAMPVAAAAGALRIVAGTDASGMIAACSLACAAEVPALGVAGVGTRFSVDVAAQHCADPVTVAWSFGDGSPPVSDTDPVHVFAAPGTFAWQITAASGSTTCTRSGTLTIADLPSTAVRRRLRP